MAAKRRALVTGAASGIGRAIAERLVADGHDVLAVDRTEAANGPGVSFNADLTTVEGNRSSVAEVVDRFGGLDLLVPCASFQHVAPIDEFPEERWDALLGVLLTLPMDMGWSAR